MMIIIIMMVIIMMNDNNFNTTFLFVFLSLSSLQIVTEMALTTDEEGDVILMLRVMLILLWFAKMT